MALIFVLIFRSSYVKEIKMIKLFFVGFFICTFVETVILGIIDMRDNGRNKDNIKIIVFGSIGILLGILSIFLLRM